MTSPVEKPHEYGEPMGDEHVETCSRCGLTRRPAPKHPKRSGTSYLHRSWGKATMLDLPCTPAMKLLSLARSSDGPEGAAAALRAMRIIAEHELVFDPMTKPLAKLLAGVAVGNAADAHEAAKLTATATLMRPGEAEARAFAPSDDVTTPKRGRGAKIASMAREILSSRVTVTMNGRGLDEIKREASGDVSDLIGSLQSFKDELLSGRKPAKPAKPTRKERT